MSPTVIDLPAGHQLEQQLEEIETQEHDAAIRAALEKRVKIADASRDKMRSHEEVSEASKARIMARFPGR